MWNLQKGGDDRMSAGLFHHPISRIDQDEGDIGGRGSGDHVSGILDMTGRIGNDEFPLGCGKVAIGYVYGDTLFTFRLQPIREEGQIDVFLSASGAGFFDLFVLILKNGFTVIEQSADKGGFTVIDRAGSGEAEEFCVFHMMKIFLFSFTAFLKKLFKN
jgi:hypothetical protein